MEKHCEFCLDLKPVVYCKADAAYFCLPCDAKVHSANALFNRHLRTLLCDSCRYHPAYALCLDHRMLICHGCDHSLHEVASQHQKEVVSSYLGCPSAEDFAALWGFGLGELDKVMVQDQPFSVSCASTKSTVSNFNILGESCPQVGFVSKALKLSRAIFISGAESGFTSSSQQTEISHKGQPQHNTWFILEQILDLHKLQVTSPMMRAQEQISTFSTTLDTAKKIETNLDDLQHSQDVVSDIHQSESPIQESKVNSLPLPFSQPEQLLFSSSAADALLGESCWQCKSPVPSSQLWSQNMQDLGICEDTVCHDNFIIPDIDTTFRNFEELFGGDPVPTRSLLDDNIASCSSVEKSLDKSNNGNARAREDAYAGSSAYASHSDGGILDSPHKLQLSYSTMSFSVSRLSADSSGTEYLDNGLSSCVTKYDDSSQSSDRDCANREARENAMMRYKQKKKARLHEKQNLYAATKPRSGVRKGGND